MKASNATTIQKDSICGICPAGCFIRATLQDGRLQRVEPRPDHPLGMICTNGAHSADIVHDPKRLQTPLKRVGPKGGYEFEPISWDAAYELIVSRLESIKRESGPEATAIYTGRGSFELSLCDTFQPEGVAVSSASSVLFPFGSPNTLGVGALCYVSFAMIAPHVTFGEMYISLDTDLENAALIVVWGANPATDSPPSNYHKILKAKQRGAKVIVIDPRRTETAKASDAEWVPIRPGTDGALALGMIQVLIEEELFDETFVRDWTRGFEELRQHTQHYRAEVVEEITGVPAETVRRLARSIAESRGASPVMYTGLEYADGGVQAIRAVFTLWAIAGQLDVPGGLLIRMRENQFPISRKGLIPNPNVRRALGRDRFPVYSLYRGESHAIALPDSVLHGNPYQIRSLIILGGSIITAWPNPELWRKTLGALDFLVCIDRYFTADAAYADLVLPATTMYEIDSYMVYGPLFSLREKLLEPVGEARDDFEILAELARRLGYGDKFPQTREQRLERALEGSGFTLEDVRRAGGQVRIEPVMHEYKKWEKGRLRPDGAPGFCTPSGKFEIASSVLEEHGYDALPVYTEPGEGPRAQPELAQRFPLVFNSGSRIFADFRSQHHGVESLAKKAPEPVVTLHRADAEARGIREGDSVWLETPRGELLYRAHVTDDIVPGAIDANMGGGGPLGSKAWRDCNVNQLTDLERYDPISGFPVYKALLCEIRLATGAEAVPRLATEPSESGAEALPCGPEGAGLARAPALRRVYLDNNATTRMHDEVLQAMLPFLGDAGGNPSSIHARGVAARGALEAARRKVAALLNCTARRLVFTGGGSEADNLAIKGAVLGLQGRGKHLITSRVEHPAVLGACAALQAFGYELSVLEVDQAGRVSPEALARALRSDTALVSIMLANNELGTVQPIAELAALAHRAGALFHTDAVQAVGKIGVDVAELDVDLLAASAHKLGGPQGVGVVYVKQGVALSPLIHGGGQERGLRAGTENVAGIVGFGKACELAERRLASRLPEQLAALRDEFERRLCGLVEGSWINAQGAVRTPNTTSIVFPGLRGESLVLALDRHGVAFSSGSACKAGSPDPSHVLRAIGLSDEHAHCTVRWSLGPETTSDDLSYAVQALEKVIRESQSSVRFIGCR